MAAMRRGRDSDSESARDTSSDDSSSGYYHESGAETVFDGRWNHPNLSHVSNGGLERVSFRSKPSTGLSSEETESCNPPGQLIFEYLEHEAPYNREPLADKARPLSSGSLPLRDYFPSQSYQTFILLASDFLPCTSISRVRDLSKLRTLTFHSLSAAMQSPSIDGLHMHHSRGRDVSSKLSLPVFCFAFHKFKVSVWDPDGVSQGQKANSLSRAADNWLRLMRVNHPDYNYFTSHYSYWR